MAKYVVKNILVEVGDAAGTVFTPVPGVRSIDMPQADTDEVESTTLDNTTGVKEFLQGMKDGGEAAMELMFDPAQHVTPANSLVPLHESGATRIWRVGLPEGTGMRYKFGAYVKSLGVGTLQPSAGLTINATLRVSGLGEFEEVT